MNLRELEVRYELIEKRINQYGCFLFGAGTNGVWVYDWCVENGILVHSFIDSNPNLIGQEISNKPVVSYEDAIASNSEAIVLVTSKHHADEILKSRWDDGLIFSFDAFFYLKNKEKFASLSFSDSKSSKVLEGIIKAMLFSDKEFLHEIAENNQYFCTAPFFNTGMEAYVDFGACTGDSIERFLFAQNGAFKEIFAFEPGESQITALRFRIKRLCKEWAIEESRIHLIKAGIGEKPGKFYLETKGNIMSSQVTCNREFGVEEIEIETIDSFFADKKISFMKFDIEGSEYKALLSGEKVIRRDKPKMAISVYHRPDDLLRIYEYVNGLNLGYKFMLRHHSSLLMDTTLYCY